MKLEKNRIFSTILFLPYLVIIIAGCANPIHDVPFSVNSAPPGSYVLLQTMIPEMDMYDWVYMGTTPVDFVREMNFKELKKAESISLRILKEGYFEQTKSWLSDDFIDHYDDKGGISWDPHLVPMK